MKSLLHSRRSMWFGCFSLLAVACLFLYLPVASRTVAAPASVPDDAFKVTVVYLVRHAERAATPREDPPLLETGTTRAQELARMLGKAGIKAIYTSQFIRTKQTAEPLATQLGIASTTMTLKMSAANAREVSAESTKEMVDKIYQRTGENVLIVGHSNSIPDVIKALGGDIVPTIDEKEFDNLFVVTVYAKGKASVAHLKY